MRQSLQEQLLKAGLVKPKTKPKSQAKQRPQKTKLKKQQPPARGKQNAQKKPTKAQQLQQQQSKRQLLNLQLQQLFDKYKAQKPLQKPEGEIRFNYVYNNKVRSIFINKKQQQQLGAAELAITVFKAKTILVDKSMVDEILQIDPQRFIFINQTSSSDDEEFPVPDDLQW